MDHSDYDAIWNRHEDRIRAMIREELRVWKTEVNNSPSDAEMPIAGAEEAGGSLDWETGGVAHADKGGPLSEDHNAAADMTEAAGEASHGTAA